MSGRVLICKLGAIGDAIMAIPAAYALHRRGAEVHWVCGAAVAPLLACYTWIHPIVADDRAILQGVPAERLKALTSLWRAIGRTKYDLCATLYYDPRYRVLCLPVRAAQKIVLSRTARETTLLDGRHHTDEYARILLGLPDGERPESLAPVHPDRLPASPLPRSGNKARVVLIPAGAKNLMRDDALRRWPMENYISLASSLLQRGFEVLLAGGPQDTWAVPRFAGLAVIDQTGKLTLPEMVALLDDSDVVVTHDTGPLHMAGITGAGLIGIFGPTNPRGRLPQRANTVALWGGEGFACRPCYDGRDYAPCLHNGCMHQVTVQMVLDQVEALMAQRNAASLRPPCVVVPISTVKAGL